MKYSLVCAAVAVSFCGSSYAFTPKVTGTLKAHLVAEENHTVIKNKSTNATTSDIKQGGRPVLNGDGRIKFSGSQKLSDMLTAAYSLEYNVRLDDDSRSFTPRSTYASIEHKELGRLRFGRITQPETDFDIAVAQSALTGGLLPFSGFATRSNNAVQYYTPYFGANKDIRVKLHYGMDENAEDTPIRTYINGNRQSIRRDMAAASIVQSGKDNPVMWGLSFTQAGKDLQAMTAMLAYNTDKWGAGLVARQADFNGPAKERGVLGTLTYTLDDNWQLYGQTGYTQNFGGAKDLTLVGGAIGTTKNIKIGSSRFNAFTEVAGERLKQGGTTAERVSDTYGVATGINFKF